MVRTSITDHDSPYVDGVIHGDGLTSLQYRKGKGEDTTALMTEVNGIADEMKSGGLGLLTATGRLHLLVDPRYEAAADARAASTASTSTACSPRCPKC